MEETLSTVASVPTRDCVHCGQPAMEGDHPIPLCHECRENFTRLNVPLWIRLFAGGVGVILLFSLFTLPRTLGIGIHLERGRKAISERKFNTAEKEFFKVLEKAPHNIEAESNLLIAAFYNQDYPVFSDQIRKVQTVNVADIGSELYNKIGSTLTEADGYIESDTLRQFKSRWPEPARIPDSAWMNYLLEHSADIYATFEFAGALFDRKEYHLTDSLVQHILQMDKEYIPALMLATSVRREEGDNDGALAYAERVLKVNKESVWGICAKARALLRQKKDRAALDLALKAGEINEKDLYTLSTLALVYHYSGRMGERDAAFKKAWAIAKNAEDSIIVQYAVDVVNKKEKFRD